MATQNSARKFPQLGGYIPGEWEDTLL